MSEASSDTGPRCDVGDASGSSDPRGEMET